MKYLPRGAEHQAGGVLSDRGVSRGGVAVFPRALLSVERPQIHRRNGLGLLQHPLQPVSGVQPCPAALAVGPQHVAYFGCDVLHRGFEQVGQMLHRRSV